MDDKKILKKKILKLVQLLYKEILKYKSEVLKERSVLNIAVYKNIENLFQDNNQHSNYEKIKMFYQDFYSKHFENFMALDLTQDILTLSVGIMKHLWKNGKGEYLPPDECENISVQESKRLIKECFEQLFNAVFHHSYVFNRIVEDFDNLVVLHNIKFRNENEYFSMLEQLGSVYLSDDAETKEKLFYKKAIKKIVENIFYHIAEEKVRKIEQTHLFYIKGINIKKLRYQISSGIELRCVKLNEIKVGNVENFIYDYDRENCVIVQKYNFRSFADALYDYYLVPNLLKLAFKHCARISYANNYLNCDADGLSTKEVFENDYDGSLINTVDDLFIESLPNLIKLCDVYIKNVETDTHSLGFLKIALDFYSQAISKVHPTHQITYACLALEALYNTNSDSILKQLKNRASILLSTILGIPKKTVIKIIQKAYEVRCSYVHAQDPLSCVDEVLVEKIMDIVRYSIILFLKLYANKFVKNKLKQNYTKFNLKSLINSYYLDNLEIMQNLETELKRCLKDSLWINNLTINNSYCNYRRLKIDEYSFVK